MNYSEKLKDPRWQKKRLEILKRDDFKCTLCGDSQSTLHVHHLKYLDDPWDIEDEFLVTHCEHCHKVIEYCKKIKSDTVITKTLKKERKTFFYIYCKTSKSILLVFYLDKGSIGIEASLGVNEEEFDEIVDFFKTNNG